MTTQSLPNKACPPSAWHAIATENQSYAQVVSQAEASGEVVALPSLGDIQGQSFSRPTVLVTQQVGGVEDIPVRMPLPKLRLTSTSVTL